MIVATGWLSDLRCCRCHRDPPVVLSAGDSGERGPGGILLRRSRKPHGWCLRCAIRRGWLAAEPAKAA